MPEVIVIGGGYAGLQAVRELDRQLGAEWSLILLDRGSHHQLVTRLPEIVAGRITADKASVPLSRLLSPRVRLVKAEVHGVDPVSRLIDTSVGAYVCDGLVLATGSVQDFVDVPGAERYGAVLKSTGDASRLRGRLLDLLGSRRRVRVAVVGAGYTGTEMAGELATWKSALSHDKTVESPVSVTLVAEDPRLLPQGNERLASVAQRVLERKGVSFVLGTPVQRVGDGELDLGAGRRIEADLVLWAVRKRGGPIVAGPGWNRSADGRVRVDSYLRATGNGVYAAGDIAAVHDYARDQPVQSSAQLAVQEGALAGRNLAAELLGKRSHEFRPLSLGEALSLGGSDGAAELAGVVVTGRAALAIKEAALVRYLTRLGGPALALRYR